MDLLKQVLKQICVLYAKSFLATVCLIVAGVLLLGLYTASDMRLMSDRELEKLLGERYEREFAVVSSRKLSQEERAEGVWRAKLFEVAPAGEPEQRFWAFNIVSGGFGGVPGASNGLRHTYVEDMLLAAFAERAVDMGLEYEVKYRCYPFKEQVEYYGDLEVVIDPVGPENLGLVCEALAGTVEDVRERLPEGYELAGHMNFRMIYREADWPAGESCTVFFWPTKPLPEGAEAMQEFIRAEAERYAEMFIYKE